VTLRCLALARTQILVDDGRSMFSEVPGGTVKHALGSTTAARAVNRASHRVYMTFFLREWWYVEFCEEDLRTPLPRTFTFSDPERIRELAKRGEALSTSESRLMLEHAIETGRGGFYLRLTPEQYRKLRRKPYRG
jgi:hypothetical protein